MFRQWESDRSLATLPVIYDLLNESLSPLYASQCISRIYAPSLKYLLEFHPFPLADTHSNTTETD